MRIFIQGMGLMGASLGLRLKEMGHHIAGSVRSEQSREILVTQGLVDITLAHGFRASQLEGFDVVFLGLNVSDCLPAIDEIMKIDSLAKTLIIADMCSTKQQICSYVAENYPHARFVGTHPMAGKELQGPAAADVTLFRDCTVYITSPNAPSNAERKQDAAVITQLWQKVGARTCAIAPAEHDRNMAYVSHGLHLAACMIAKMSGGAAGDSNTPSPAAGSYRDMTRIALSSGAMWQDITMSNRVHVAEWLKELSTASAELAAQVEHGSADIVSLFHDAAASRAKVMRT
jgi:prephenate dehydrogenase